MPLNSKLTPAPRHIQYTFRDEDETVSLAKLLISALRTAFTPDTKAKTTQKRTKKKDKKRGGIMPFEREPKKQPDDREMIPMGHAFAIALRSQTGPCSRAACPIPDGEIWKPGKCMLDGCPRQKQIQLSAGNH